MRKAITRKASERFTEIHNKLIGDKPLSDEEVEQGISFFADLEMRLMCLGPVHTLSARECGRLLERLKGFKRARSGMKLRHEVDDSDRRTVCISESPAATSLSSLPYTMQRLAKAELEYLKVEFGETSSVRSAMRFTMPYAIHVGLVLEWPKFLIVPAEHTTANGYYMPNALSKDCNPSINDTVNIFCVINTDYNSCIDGEDGGRALYRSIHEAVDNVITLIGLGNESSVCR